MTSLLETLGVRAKALTLNTLTSSRQSWEIDPGAWDNRWPSADYAGNEPLGVDFDILVEKAYKEGGPVFSCMLARQMLFSEARFQFRNRTNGKAGELFGHPNLGLLESPWPSGTTSNLLTRIESDASLAGNAYYTTADDAGNIGRASVGGLNRRMARLRPDWVTIVVGVPGSPEPRPWAVAARILAYLYEPPPWAQADTLGSYSLGGYQGDSPESVVLLPDEVAHYNPIPDPAARWRGMSWLTPIIREIEADKAATTHKRRFFKHGAVPTQSVSFDKDVSTATFEKFIELYEQKHGGVDNSFKPMFLVGADVRPMTFDFTQLDMRGLQGAAETRIASAARVPPVIAIMSEGLGATSYATYAAAKRHFADGWARPAWRDVSASLQTLVKPDDQPRAELWYDDREISFLRDDAKDAAEIQTAEVSTLNALVSAGWTTESALAFVRSGDWQQLKHSGLVSVQLQAPGSQTAADPAADPANTPLPPGVRRLPPPANGAANNG